MVKIILHVEDDDNDALLFQSAMEKAEPGCSLRIVSDGQMAIDYLGGVGKFQDREAFPLPILVLLDLKLPQVPGLDVLKWMRSQPALVEIPVVILSSSKHEEDVSNAYGLGANAYLVKPSDRGQLQRIAQMVALVKKSV
jgi:CheY-like chemotaxis protein